MKNPNEPSLIDHPDPNPGRPGESAASRMPRLTFPTLCLVVFWAVTLGVGAIDKPYFFGFMFGLGWSAILTVCLAIWWIFNRRLSWSDKILGAVFLIGEAWVVGKLADKSINAFTLWTLGFPLALSAGLAWIFLARKFELRQLGAGLAVVITLAWSYLLLIRGEGADSRLKYAVHWRWAPTAEQRFLTKSRSQPTTAPAPSLTTGYAPGDWSEFRGTNRDGVVSGTTVATNWTSAPPTLVWKHEVGPAWSSVIVAKGRLYTQEQRGEKEGVVCYDANTGSELWAHEDVARFDETVSGIGPRATPTFASGHIYALGATGMLNCLDTATGRSLWNRDITKDTEATVQTWGLSGSPLVIDGKVIVYGGGNKGKGLLAYRADSGELVWAAAAGESSYSSAQANTINGVSQCLILSDSGLTSVNPASGEKLWETGQVWKGAPRCGQPHRLSESRFLVGALDGLGTSLVEVSKKEGKWGATNVWISKDLKPEFPDFVVQDDYAYGFDVSMFCCVNLRDGKRSWKEGRYGRGQVVLLKDQRLLVVTSETGALILLQANPSASVELGRFQALEGKTWNHAVVVGNRLWVRNAQEMACYSASQPIL